MPPQVNGERFVQTLRDIAPASPGVPVLSALARAAGEGDVAQFSALLSGMAGGRGPGARQDWAPVIRDLLRQVEARQSATSLARKKEGLERLLINFGSDPLLYDKLQALLNTWAEQPDPTGPIEASPPAVAPTSTAARCRARAGTDGLLAGRRNPAGEGAVRTDSGARPGPPSGLRSGARQRGAQSGAAGARSARCRGLDTPRRAAQAVLVFRSSCAAKIRRRAARLRSRGCSACWSTISASWSRTISG